MKILILAYACEPGTGSEYGVGWMVPTTMARLHPEYDIYVLTRSRCREKIESNITLTNLHFLFYDIPSWLTYSNEMSSKWGEQINYLTWQLMVRRFIRKQNNILHFDVIHHLTFNQYRTPSPGYWMDIPFVVGPIGGAEYIAPAFWEDLDAHTRKKEEIRLKGKDLKIFRWFNTRKNNKKILLCSSKENLERLAPYKGNSEITKLPAIAYSPDDFEITKSSSQDDDAFTMIYAGKAWDWKGLLIFLRAVKTIKLDLKDKKISIQLIGIRFKDEQDKVIRWVEELGLQNCVTLIPFIERSRLLQMMTTCSLSVYPAFRDSGSMSILEACALGCPSICFNCGGQDIFPDDILLKVPVGDTYENCMNAFAEKLHWAIEHPLEAKAIGLKSKSWVEENLTWERKVEQFNQIYNSII